MNILLSFVHHNDRFIRFTAVSWVYELILLDDVWVIPYARILRSLHDKAAAACSELIKSVAEELRGDFVVANKGRKSGFSSLNRGGVHRAF